MKHKLVTLVLAVAVIASLVFVGCAKPAPAEPIKLRFSHMLPPQSVHHTDVYVPWIQMIEERTAAIGKPVEITIFPAQALGKHFDQYNLVVAGTADIVGDWGPHQMPGRFPLAEGMQLPFLFPNSTVACQVGQEVFDKWPELQAEVSEAKLLWHQPTAPAQLSCRTKQIKTLEDFKGMKVHSPGGLRGETAKALGGVPTRISMPEAYPSLERGLLDVAPNAWESFWAFKWYEVTKYRTALPRGLYLAGLMVSMNWDAWNSLPPDVQAIFEELSGMYMSEFSGKAYDKANMECLERLKEYDKKAGNPEVYYMPEDEFQRWVEAATPVREAWVADMEAQGLPGKAILEDMLSLTKKYSK